MYIYEFNFFRYDHTTSLTVHIKHIKSTNIKHFDLRLLTEEKSERIVRFFPEKHKLLKVIEQENDGCEIKRFKRTEQKYILITDYITFKKMRLDFKQPIHNAVFQEISTVKKELPFLDMVNVKGIV